MAKKHSQKARSRRLAEKQTQKAGPKSMMENHCQKANQHLYINHLFDLNQHLKVFSIDPNYKMSFLILVLITDFQWSPSNNKKNISHNRERETTSIDSVKRKEGKPGTSQNTDFETTCESCGKLFDQKTILRHIGNSHA